MNDYNTARIEELKKCHPADIARQIQELAPHDIVRLFEKIPDTCAAPALVEIDKQFLKPVLEKLPDQTLARYLEILSPNESVDLLEFLPPARKSAIISKLSKETAAHITSLMQYPPDTAGGIMSDRFFQLYINETIGESLERIRAHPERRPDDVSYLYVVDEENRLVGVVQVHDLLFGKPDKPLAEIVKKDVKSLKTTSDKEQIARMFAHYHFLGLPVVDDYGRLVGVVKAADAVEIAQNEATEDMQLMVGLSGIEKVSTPWHTSLKQRLPWLYANVATSLLAGGVVGIFEGTIGKWTTLAIFLPIIISHGSNSGLQTLTIIIRELALGEFQPGESKKALKKELILALLSGIATGIFVGVIGYLWKGNLMIGVVAFLAMVLSQVTAAFSGVLVPLALRLFKIDPAVASSIILTTLTDIAGIFFLLGLASIASRYITI